MHTDILGKNIGELKLGIMDIFHCILCRVLIIKDLIHFKNLINRYKNSIVSQSLVTIAKFLLTFSDSEALPTCVPQFM